MHNCFLRFHPKGYRRTSSTKQQRILLDNYYFTKDSSWTTYLYTDGHFLLQLGGTISWCALLFVEIMFFFDFLAVLSPSWRHLGSIWEVWGLILERFWGRFWKVLGSTLDVFGDNLGPRLLLENLRLLLENLVFRSVLLASGSGWAGGVTRSAKDF